MSLTDLHICKNSITSASSGATEKDSCYCLPEYDYYEICQEGSYSATTCISWQRFPRSTSSPSRCDDSDETLKTVIQSKTLSTIKEEEESAKPSSTEYPITKSFSQLNALHYLEVRHIFQFLNFLLSHLVCNEPEDPVLFLTQLLEKCLKYRDAFGEAPQLFTLAHMKSVYAAFDPFERGYLTLSQYKEAMRSLGLEHSITPYNPEPPLDADDFVEENYFMTEAERCLTENLNKMLRIPKTWEENRLIWKKKMARLTRKRAKALQKKQQMLEKEATEDKFEEEKANSRDTRDFEIVNRFYKPCPGLFKLKDMKINHEPEQLFLN